MAIAFPYWERGDEGNDSPSEGDCFVFVPTQLGIDLLVEENLPLRRATYRRATSGCELIEEEGMIPSNELDDYWDLTSFPGAYVQVARQARCGTPAPTIPRAIASQRGWEIHPVCYSMRFRGG